MRKQECGKGVKVKRGEVGVGEGEVINSVGEGVKDARQGGKKSSVQFYGEEPPYEEGDFATGD